MTKIVRTLFKPIALLLAIVQNAAAAPTVGLPPFEGPPPTFTTFIKRLGQDPAFRARFSRDPQAAFRETGIDPSPYNLPDRLDDGQIDRFLRDWVGPVGPAAGARLPGGIAVTFDDRSAVAQNLIYGPPPGRRDAPPPPDEQKPPPDPPKKPPDGAAPPPPMPVYGPPPGRSN